MCVEDPAGGDKLQRQIRKFWLHQVLSLCNLFLHVVIQEGSTGFCTITLQLLLGINFHRNTRHSYSHSNPIQVVAHSHQTPTIYSILVPLSGIPMSFPFKVGLPFQWSSLISSVVQQTLIAVIFAVWTRWLFLHIGVGSKCCFFTFLIPRNHRLGGMALTCYISHNAKHRKMADFNPSGSQNPLTDFRMLGAMAYKTLFV